MTKQNILFLCTGNSCRSQMAEGWCKERWPNRFNAYSAGTESHGLNPRAITVMKEVGIDISTHESTKASDMTGIDFDVVVTVCDHAHTRCPVFPGKQRLHYNFGDPPAITRDFSDEQEILSVYRQVRDEIKTFVDNIQTKTDCA